MKSVEIMSLNLIQIVELKVNLAYVQLMSHRVIYNYVNPLTPKSDRNLISPYNITPDSGIKVMRVKEMIPYRRCS